jgi:hypothetical protein
VVSTAPSGTQGAAPLSAQTTRQSHSPANEQTRLAGQRSLAGPTLADELR